MLSIGCTNLQDLVYKGVLKITYDRGYVLQTKSVLTESNSTVEEVIDQLIDALGLTGSCDDYVLEERNLITNGIEYYRTLSNYNS